MYKDEPSDVFTLEDIMKEFGSGTVSTESVPAPPAEPAAPVTPAAPRTPMPAKGTIPFQTSRLPKISEEELRKIDQKETQLFRPVKEQPAPEVTGKPSRKERKAAKAAEKEAARRAREAKKEAALEAKWAAKEARKTAKQKPVPTETVQSAPGRLVEKPSVIRTAVRAPQPVCEPEDELEAIIREFSSHPAAEMQQLVQPATEEPAAIAAASVEEPVEAPAATVTETEESVIATEEITETVAEEVETAEEPESIEEVETETEAAPVEEPTEEAVPVDEETSVEPEESIVDEAEPALVNVEELESSVAAAAAEVDLPLTEEPEEESILEKMPDPVHNAPAAPEPPAGPRPTRHQAAAQSAAELGLMSDSELDAIIREFSDEPDKTYRQQERLEALEQTLQDDLRINQTSDFFEEQFGGYAGPQPDPNDIGEVEEPGFFAKLKKMLEEPEEEPSTPEEPEPEGEAPEASKADDADPAGTAFVPEQDDAPVSAGIKLQIPDDVEPGVPFTLNIPAEAAPQEPEQPAEETQKKKARKTVPFRTAPKADPDAQVLDEMGLEEEDEDDDELFTFLKKKPKKAPVEEPPITSAHEGCLKYSKQLKGVKLKVQLSGIIALLSFALSVYYSLDWQFIGFLANGAIVGWMLNILLVLSCVICLDVIRSCIDAAMKKQFGLEALTCLAALVALIDGIIGAIHGRVPYCATASVLLWLALLSRYLQAEGMLRTMKVLEKNGVSSGIVRSENVYHGKAALFTAEVTEEEFLDHIRKSPLSDQVLQIYTPLVVLLTLILAIVAAIKGKADFIQSWAPMLLAAVPASGLLCYSRTFAILAKRLAKRGAALCGWYGACALGNHAAVLLRDEDLFPNGMMEPNGVKSFNGYTGNQVVGYAAAVLEKAGSGLAPVLNSLLERDGGRHMQVDAIRLYENGGIGGKFNSDAILVGTLGFMKRMGVHMSQEARVKRATYVSVNGELAGLIAMRYGASGAVKDALGILTRSGRTKPILATCNVSITPKLLKQKFRIEPERLEFPDLRDRAELAARSADPDSIICAVLSKEHIASFADTAVGGRILQTVVKVGLIMAIISGLIGVSVLGVLSLTGAIAGLSAAYLLLFDLIWLIPVMLLTSWTRSY